METRRMQPHADIDGEVTCWETAILAEPKKPRYFLVISIIMVYILDQSNTGGVSS
jgi:hypothetical protein